ncbi:hypothetical protein GCM10027614_09120 [Micromonospora vulcania]
MQQRPGRAQGHVRLTEAVVEHRGVGQRPGAEGTAAAGGGLVGGVAYRALGDAEVDRGDEQTGLGDPKDRAAYVVAVADQAEAAVLGADPAGRAHVLAGGAAQAEHLPGVQQLQLAAGKEHHPGQRRPVGQGLRGPAVEHDAVQVDPARLGAAGHERPLTVDPPTAGAVRGGPALRRDRAGAQHVRTARVDLVAGGLGEAGEQQVRQADLADQPAGGGVRSGELLDHPQRLAQRQVGAAVRGGHQHPQAARGGEVGDDVVRDPARPVYLRCPLGECGEQSVDARQRTGHGCTLSPSSYLV